MVVMEASNCFLNFEILLSHNCVVSYDIILLWI